MDFDLVQGGTTAWSEFFPKRDWAKIAREIGELTSYTPVIQLDSSIANKLGPHLLNLGMSVSERASQMCFLFGALAACKPEKIDVLFVDCFQSDAERCWFSLFGESFQKKAHHPLMDVYESDDIKVVRTASPLLKKDKAVLHYHYLIWERGKGITESDESVEFFLHRSDVLVKRATAIGWSARIVETETENIGCKWLLLKRH
ncbi:MAG: hypothetical protein CMK59_06530 [Proteobacteria bacterium]|nr:hypothetical protein [Pseudomonadota bacterium]